MGRKAPPAPRPKSPSSLQKGLVLEEDIQQSTLSIADAYIQEQRAHRNGPSKLYHDTDFRPIPSSINGIHKTDEIPKCRCSVQAVLAYSQKAGPNLDRPYYTCSLKRCNYFQWAYTSHLMQWYRLGVHTNHVLVQNNSSFSAEDLLQGKVGDCWFLSALAVVAERPDLISRLFDTKYMNEFGIVQLRLFVDGFWKSVVVDNFLPCFIDAGEESDLARALEQSLGGSSTRPVGSRNESNNDNSETNPHVMYEENHKILQDTFEFLEYDREKKLGPSQRRQSKLPVAKSLSRLVTSNDLAYSKAKNQQLWVPLLEKAYAKVHGSYKAISGGHIAEAFLDLTGAPTIQYDLQSSQFDGRAFWYQLLSYRQRRLPMGCGTSTSQVGIIGMHAYSILDVREIRNVNVDFFRNDLLSGTLGNVSGFTEYDGTVRLLRIRNPHGKGEWKGNFSDNSPVWQRLIANQEKKQHAENRSPELKRTMNNDGVFYIDYDSFLMGFSNVDVVLAFEGNHAKSFATTFPPKKSNHRCVHAFEVSLLDDQPDLPSQDTVEVYVIGIQKNRRGSSHGRADRKKSYKLSDMGILVGKDPLGNTKDKQEHGGDGMIFQRVEGRMFGFRRNGHYRLTLDRRKNRSLVVMPISFGHPAATDKEFSYALRFVADAPIYIRELPTVPRVDLVLETLLFGPGSIDPSHHNLGVQGSKLLLLEDKEGIRQFGEARYRVYQIDYLAGGGGTVFCYLCVNDPLIESSSFEISLSMEVTCRGMNCRTKEGLLQHETLSKGKKFEAAWRKFSCHFQSERKSRLLMTLVKSGQDTEMGTATCSIGTKLGNDANSKENSKKQNTMHSFLGAAEMETVDGSPSDVDDYKTNGVYNAIRFSQQRESIFGLSSRDQHNPGVSTTHSLNAEYELQMALAKSRSEISQDPDSELAKAIAESLESEKMFVLPDKRSNVNSDKTFEQDLKRATELSLQMPSSKASDTEVVDLSSPMPVQEKKRKAEVIVLDDDEEDHNDDQKRKALEADSSVDYATKRRLAAEAALRRQKKI